MKESLKVQVFSGDARLLLEQHNKRHLFKRYLPGTFVVDEPIDKMTLLIRELSNCRITNHI